jgi:hypothetical protein
MPRHNELRAASDVAEKFGVHGYQFDLDSNQLRFTAADSSGNTLTTITFHGSKLDDDSDVKAQLNDPTGKMHGKITHVEASGRWGKLQMPHGSGLDGADLPSQAPVMLAELQAFGEDIGAQVSAAHQQSATGGEAHAMIDGMCFLASIGAAVWPIGTALCGPTAAVCVYYYFFM